MRRFVPVLLALATMAAPVAAQSHPDFSGKWILDTKSVEGPMVPLSMTLNVTQDTKTIAIETASSSTMGDQKSSTSYNIDGSQSKNSVNTPNGALELVSTTAWDGSTFVVTTKGEIQGQQFQQSDRWSIDAGGKTLRTERNVAVMGQSISMKLVFNKQ